MSDKPCKRCGDTRPGDTTCSRCGGPGLIHGREGDPIDCPSCGCSGIEWPPRCPRCSAFRAWDSVPARTYMAADTLAGSY